MGNLQAFNSQEAQAMAKRISGQADMAKQAIERVHTDIRSLETWWKGDSSSAFVQEFEQLKPSLNKLVETVNKISAQLIEVAKAKEDAEQAIASAIRK